MIVNNVFIYRNIQLKTETLVVFENKQEAVNYYAKPIQMGIACILPVTTSDLQMRMFSRVYEHEGLTPELSSI